MTFAKGWCAVDPDAVLVEGGVEEAVTGWVDQAPELRPAYGTLVELMRDGAGTAAGSGGEAFALMAAPWGETLLSGYLTVRLWRSPLLAGGGGVDLGAVLDACRANLAGVEAPGLAEAAAVVLDSGLPAVRVRKLSAPEQDGAMVVDALVYYVPCP